MTKTELEAAAIYYERHIRQMQDWHFYVETPDGLLRRWYPPKLFNQTITRETDK
jgi:hypothetical protein